MEPARQDLHRPCYSVRCRFESAAHLAHSGSGVVPQKQAQKVVWSVALIELQDSALASAKYVDRQELLASIPFFATPATMLMATPPLASQ
jgi:hypothetical protein